jgi:ketosteroid isomerase-like protein
VTNRQAVVAVRILLIAIAAMTGCGEVFSTRAQGPDNETQIRALLKEQAEAWNRGDIDSFMTSYWKSNQTLFVGATGIARGWQAVLDRYHRVYPDRKAMGQLTFSNLEVHNYCSDAALVVGNYHLERENDHPEGVFTLDLRKFPEGWRIVADHTTAFAAVRPAQTR